ncbi:hypothetical protein ABIC16_003682 [Sphingomonas sp. PvP055]
MTDMDFDLSRRSFLDRVLMAAAGAGMTAAAPWAAIAAGTAAATSDRIRIGVIGTGDRGRTLIQNINKTRNCMVAAICDNYEPHLTKARPYVGANTPVYADHRAMLEKGGLDALVIATPLNLHAKHVLDGFDAGLHVWCEKAMARTIPDCGAMVKRSQDSRKILQIGHQRMFHPNLSQRVAPRQGRRDRIADADPRELAPQQQLAAPGPGRGERPPDQLAAVPRQFGGVDDRTRDASIAGRQLVLRCGADARDGIGEHLLLEGRARDL